MANMLTNVPVRSINDLTQLTYIPFDVSVLKNVKIPVGNLPLGLSGESVSLEQMAQILPLNNITTQSIEAEKNRALKAEDDLRKAIKASQEGTFGFATMLDFNNSKATVPVNSVVHIAQGEDAGTYTWDGVNLTKAIADVNAFIETQVDGLKQQLVSVLKPDAESKYSLYLKGYYEAKRTDGVEVYDTLQQSEVYASTPVVPVKAGDYISWQTAVYESGPYYSAATLNIYDKNKKVIKSIAPFSEVGNHIGTTTTDSANWIPRGELLITEDGFVTLTAGHIPEVLNDLFLKVNSKTAITQHVVATLQNQYPFKEKVEFKEARQFATGGGVTTEGIPFWYRLSVMGTKSTPLLPVKKGDMIEGVLAIQAGMVGNSSTQYAVFNNEQRLVKLVQGIAIKNISGTLLDIQIIADEDGYIQLATDYSLAEESEVYIYRTNDNSLYKSTLDVADYYAEKNGLYNEFEFSNLNPLYSDIGNLTQKTPTYKSTGLIAVKAGEVFEVKVYPVALVPTITDQILSPLNEYYPRTDNVSLITLLDTRGGFVSSQLKAKDYTSSSSSEPIYMEIKVEKDGYLHVASSNNAASNDGMPYLRKKTNSGLAKALREAQVYPRLDEEKIVFEIKGSQMEQQKFGLISGDIYTTPLGCCTNLVEVKAGDLIEGAYYSEEESTTWFNPALFFNTERKFIKTLINNAEITSQAAYVYDTLKLKKVVTNDGYVVLGSAIPNVAEEKTQFLEKIYFKITRNAGLNYLDALNTHNHMIDLVEAETLSDDVEYPFYMGLGRTFNNELLPKANFSGTKKIPVKTGDVIDISVLIELAPTVSQTIINKYDQFGRSIGPLDFAATHFANSSHVFEKSYTIDFNGFITVTHVNYANRSFVPSVKNKTLQSKKQLTTTLAKKLKSVFATSGGANTQRNANTYSLPNPTDLIRIDLKGQIIPNSKAEGSIQGEVTITTGGASVTLNTKYGVQGDSSVGYPKKNLSFDLYTDDTFKNDAFVKIAGLVAHPTLVYKSNYVDATLVRNIVANNIYEQMIESRKTFPKQIWDQTQSLGDVKNSVQTGAIGHAAGFPCVFYFNNEFYGLGSLNIHKRRENYNLNKDNTKHIQLDPINSYTTFSGDFNSGTAWTDTQGVHTINETFEVRNPKIKNYQAGAKLTSGEVLTSIQRLWNFNGKTDAEIAADFDKYYNRTDVIDTVLLIHVFALADLIGKNTLLTTWDGKIWSPLAFDLDSICGLAPWDGRSIAYDTNVTLNGFYPRLFSIVIEDAKKRYADLRRKDIFSISNLTKLLKEQQSKFTLDLFKQEQNKWVDIPSKDLGGILQIQQWFIARLAWLDCLYAYVDVDLGVKGQKTWNPPTLKVGASQTTTINVPGIVKNTPTTVKFSGDLKGTSLKAEVLTDGVVTITHTNNTAEVVNLSEYALQVF